MVFEPGNTVNKKLTTPELKMEAYSQYCHHLSLGKSKKSWWFEHPELTLTWETMEKYIKNEPDVFDPIKKQIATSKGLYKWEEICEKAGTGENEKASIPGLQMIMRNKFGWDKIDFTPDDNSAEINSNFEKLMGQISQSQKPSNILST